MNLRYKIFSIALGTFILTAILQRCNKPGTITNPGTTTITTQGNTLIVTPNVKPGQSAQPPVHVYQPDPGSTTITVDTHGSVTYHVRQFGVGFEPGVGFGYSDRARIALDARIAYFKRFGINTGLGWGLDRNSYLNRHLFDIVDPYLGVSFVPTTKMPNTSFVVSYTAGKHFFIFTRMRF